MIYMLISHSLSSWHSNSVTEATRHLVCQILFLDTRYMNKNKIYSRSQICIMFNTGLPSDSEITYKIFSECHVFPLKIYIIFKY